MAMREGGVILNHYFVSVIGLLPSKVGTARQFACLFQVAEKEGRSTTLTCFKSTCFKSQQTDQDRPGAKEHPFS